MLDDRSMKAGVGQHITTLDKYKIPISIIGGLPYIPLRPYTNKELENLPHAILTSDKYWDPTYLDCEGQLNNEEWFDAQSYFPNGPNSKLFNEYGEHRNTCPKSMSCTSLMQKHTKKIL